MQIVVWLLISNWQYASKLEEFVSLEECQVVAAALNADLRSGYHAFCVELEIEK